MRRTRTEHWGLIFLLLVMGPVSGLHAQGGTGTTSIIRVGLIRSLFRDMDEKVALAQTQALGELFCLQTGLGATFSIVPDAETMARQLQGGELHLGVVHGVEYGWARKRADALQPLVLAFNQKTDLRGYLVVRDEDPARRVEDLRRKRLAVPLHALNHIHLFLDHCLRETDGTGLFAACNRPATADAALDDVIDGRSDAAAVDGLQLEVYKKRKPGRFSKLRILSESMSFPTAALVYEPDAVDPKTLRRIQDGLLCAHQRPLGRQLLTLWKLSRFTAVSEDYDEKVELVLKSFPAPVEARDLTATKE